MYYKHHLCQLHKLHKCSAQCLSEGTSLLPSCVKHPSGATSCSHPAVTADLWFEELIIIGSSCETTAKTSEGRHYHPAATRGRTLRRGNPYLAVFLHFLYPKKGRALGWRSTISLSLRKVHDLQKLHRDTKSLQPPGQLRTLRNPCSHLKEGLPNIDFYSRLCQYNAKCHLKYAARALLSYPLIWPRFVPSCVTAHC